MTKPPVVLVHGDRDEVLPIIALHQSEAALKGLDLEVATYLSPGLGHSIDEVGLRLGARFLIEKLA